MVCKATFGLITFGTVRQRETFARRSLIIYSQLLPSILCERKGDHQRANSSDTVGQCIP